MRRLLAVFTVALVLMLGSGTPVAKAGLISGDTSQSTEGLGNFTGSLVYNATTSTNATLVVTLTNTSPAANGGFITAFVFNNPGNLITGVSLASNFSGLTLAGAPSFNNSINGAPFGDFDIGAGTGGQFEGGGSPNVGIPVGGTGVFTFTLTGTNLNTLSQASFESTLSANPGGGGPEFFVARFRGFNDRGSDKVPAGPGQPTPIPEPATMTLAAIGLAGLLGYGWRHRKSAAAAP